jgi:hypothetical protein
MGLQFDQDHTCPRSLRPQDPYNKTLGCQPKSYVVVGNRLRSSFIGPVNGTYFACDRIATAGNWMVLRRLRKNIFLRWPLPVIVLLCCNGAARAENAEISSRREIERTDFTDDEIKDGFFKVAFTAEMQIGAPSDRIRKFDEPVRIFVDNEALPNRSAEIADVVADIRARIAHLDISITSERQDANFVVMLVSDRGMTATIRARYGDRRAKQIEKSLNPQCLSGIGKDKQYRIRRAEVILPVDAGEFTFYDCAFEELLQALGAINDDSSVPWTMFNDDVQMGFFDVYDQYLLNLLYDPRVRPGMTKRRSTS